MSTAPAATEFQRPSISELTRQVRDAFPGYRLYRWGSDFWRQEFGGNQYRFPPDLGGKLIPDPDKPGEMVKADGILLIKDRVGTIYNAKGKATGIGPVEHETAFHQVLFFADNYAEYGVVWLKGDHTDVEQRAESRKRVMAAMRRSAEAEIRARHEFIDKWQKSNPGTPLASCPPPTPRQIEAQELLDQLVEDRRDHYGYVCECQMYATNDFVSYERHARLRHGKTVHPLESDANAHATTDTEGAGVDGDKKGRKKGGA